MSTETTSSRWLGVGHEDSRPASSWWLCTS